MIFKIRSNIFNTQNEELFKKLSKYGFTYTRYKKESSKYYFKEFEVIDNELEQEEVEYDFDSMGEFIEFCKELGPIQIKDDTIFVFVGGESYVSS